MTLSQRYAQLFGASDPSGTELAAAQSLDTVVSVSELDGYLASHPTDQQIADVAARYGLSAAQIAVTLSVGTGSRITSAQVEDWVARSVTDGTPSHAWGWNAAGALVHLQAMAVTVSGSESRTLDAPSVQVLDIASTGGAAAHNQLSLSASAQSVLVVAGDAALDLSRAGTLSLLSVTTIAGADFNAGLHVDLYGDLNNVTLALGDGADVVVSGFGSDFLATGAGNDIIFAGRANDTVNAGAGNDWIRGGPGADLMTGGSGADTFAYSLVYESQGTLRDTITDFTVGAAGDVIDFHELTQGAGLFAGTRASYAGVVAALAAGTVTAAFDAGTGTLYLDADASGTLDDSHDMAIQLAGIVQGLTGANFLF